MELTGYNIKVLTTKIKRVEYELSLQAKRVMDNSNSILFLSGTISVLLSEMERYLALHERVKSELDHVLDALDNWSNNLLSHSVIRPSVLKRLIEHVKQQLAEKYSNYELVITEVHDYIIFVLVHLIIWMEYWEYLFHYLLDQDYKNLCICRAMTRPPCPSSTTECLCLIARLRGEQASAASGNLGHHLRRPRWID